MRIFPYQAEGAITCDPAWSIRDQVDAISGIAHAASIDDAMRNLFLVDEAKRALEFADNFKANSVRFAMLECAALVRVVQLGGAKKIRPRRRRLAAEWLASMNESERVQYIDLCNDGITIEHIWQRIIGDPKQRETAEIKAKAYSDSIIDTYDQIGIVSLESFDSRLDSMNLPSDVAQGFKDRVRDKLRRRNALGVGDGSGTYVNPDKTDQLSKAICVRVSSIEADLINLIKIARRTDDEDLPIVGIDTRHNQTFEMPVGDAIMMLLAYCGVVRIETNNIAKAEKIIYGFIRTVEPAVFTSTALLDSISKEFAFKGNKFSDKYGDLELYLKNWLEAVSGKRVVYEEKESGAA